MADDYERKVYELCKSGKLGWSSGSAPHRVKKAADGHITSWPICEGSLTPEPAEPRNKGGILPLKSLLQEIVMGQPEATSTKLHEELVAEIKSLKTGQASLIAAIKDMCEKLAKSDDAPPADEEATAAKTDEPEEEATASKTDEEAPEDEEATASKADEEAAEEEAKNDEEMEDEYKNLPPAQKAWVDRQLAEIAKMQKELDRRRDVKSNHAKRLRAAALGRGIRV